MGMSISLLHNDEKEHIRHLNAIRLLQREAPGYGVDEHVVQLLYEAELAELKATSRITTFLSVLTMRRVREVFRYVEYVHTTGNPSSTEAIRGYRRHHAGAGHLDH